MHPSVINRKYMGKSYSNSSNAKFSLQLPGTKGGETYAILAQGLDQDHLDPDRALAQVVSAL
jgi:hypothetical protein